MKLRNCYGFTLIEVMIVVAIIGILAAIAYPSYQTHVRDTRRADCEGAMLGLANAMERFFSRNNTYVGASLGTAATDIYPATCPIDAGTITYNLTLPTQTATTFTINAAPAGPQAGDTCGVLTLNQQLVKTAAGGTVAQCWQ